MIWMRWHVNEASMCTSAFDVPAGEVCRVGDDATGGDAGDADAGGFHRRVCGGHRIHIPVYAGIGRGVAGISGIAG